MTVIPRSDIVPPLVVIAEPTPELVIVPAVPVTVPKIRFRPALMAVVFDESSTMPPSTVTKPLTETLLSVVVPPVALKVPPIVVAEELSVPKVPPVTDVLPLTVAPVRLAVPPETIRDPKVPFPLSVPPVVIFAEPVTVEFVLTFVVPPEATREAI